MATLPRVWKSARGDLLPNEMDTDHMINALRLLERRGSHPPIVGDFMMELTKRARNGDRGAERFLSGIGKGEGFGSKDNEILVAPPSTDRIKRAITCV